MSLILKSNEFKECWMSTVGMKLIFKQTKPQRGLFAQAEMRLRGKEHLWVMLILVFEPPRPTVGFSSFNLKHKSNFP